jgi:uncharacterized membrane protein YqjE
MTPDSQPRPAGPPGQTGNVLDHLRELIAAGSDYVQARASLAGIEAKEAAIHFGILIGLCAAAMGLLVFGYFFMCIALTVLIALALGISPGWVILAFAILHFVIAIGALAVVFFRIKTPVFTATLAEMKRDQEWLRKK